MTGLSSEARTSSYALINGAMDQPKSLATPIFKPFASGRGTDMTEIFFPESMDERARGHWIRLRLPTRFGLPLLGCGWTEQGTWFFEFGQARPQYVLKYRTNGKRAGSEKWARHDVNSVREAIDFMNSNKDKAFLPASVITRSWRAEVVAILN